MLCNISCFSTRFALVDFGLAQRASTPLKSKTNDSSTKLPGGIVPAKSGASKTEEGCAKQPLASPRKRKRDSVENTATPRLKVSCLEKADDAVKLKAEGYSGKDMSVDVDRKLQPLDQNRLVPVSFTTSAVVFKSTYSKSIKSPRRALLTRRAFDARKESLESLGNMQKGKQVLPEGRKDLATPKQAEDFSNAAARRSSGNGVCSCYGQPTVCSVCLCR